MIKHGIDQDALITRFSQATAQQGDALRKAVHTATLKGLQGRELTLTHIRQVLNTVAKAAASGTAGSPLGQADAEALLGKAFAGMLAGMRQGTWEDRDVLFVMTGGTPGLFAYRDAIASDG